jgi:hypothetical protein
MGAWTFARPSTNSQKPVLGTHRNIDHNVDGTGLKKLVLGDIRAVQALCMDPTARLDYYKKSRPVFLVTFKDNTTLIIKGESNRRMMSKRIAPGILSRARALGWGV